VEYVCDYESHLKNLAIKKLGLPHKQTSQAMPMFCVFRAAVHQAAPAHRGIWAVRPDLWVWGYNYYNTTTNIHCSSTHWFWVAGVKRTKVTTFLRRVRDILDNKNDQLW